MAKRRALGQGSSETTSTAGPKHKSQSDPEPVKTRWTESETPSNSQSSETEQQPETPERTKSVLVSISREEFEEKYLEVEKIGEGVSGTVYSGYRLQDLLPVAIKHIQKSGLQYHPVVLDGEVHRIPLEVALMVAAAGDGVTVSDSAAVALLAWCFLGNEVVLIMEKPEYCRDLVGFLDICDVSEALALYLMKQLVVAAAQMHSAGIFHRDLKPENILIQIQKTWPSPRVRIIDFGSGRFVTSGYHIYTGTAFCSPPEFSKQYEGGPNTVWQLGVLLFIILSSGCDSISDPFHSEYPPTKAIMKLSVSDDCKNLLLRCLTLNPSWRITLEQLQVHAWFT